MQVIVLDVILEHYGEEGYQELRGKRHSWHLPKFEKFGGPARNHS